MRIAAVCFAASLAVPPALAAQSDKLIIGLAATQTEDQIEQGAPVNAKGTDRVTIYDLSLGYLMSPGFVLGLRYWNFEQNTSTTTDTGIVTSGYGPMLGFMHESGVFLTATYLLEPKKEYDPANTQSDVTYYGGTGSLFGVGYVKLLQSFGVGLMIQQSEVRYEKAKLGSGDETSLSGDWVDKSMYPYLQLFLLL
jgi:hypothetical protein